MPSHLINFTLYHLSPTLANHTQRNIIGHLCTHSSSHTHNHVISLVIYTPTLHHTTPLASVCYKTCLTPLFFFTFVRSWQRPSWPKRPGIIVIDSATYLLTISSPDINKVAMNLYNIISGLLPNFAKNIQISNFIHTYVRTYVNGHNYVTAPQLQNGQCTILTMTIFDIW